LTKDAARMTTTRFIFITGGVVSSLGKGIASSALGALLQARGYKVRLRKLDPYLNVDPGTMSPTQHGEVYVTDDGAETDLDLGHYERFTGVAARQTDNVTTGKIYSTVIAKERRGDYLGATVQVIPHVTDAIKEFIKSDLTNEDFCICEIGGTVGDIESLPFLEAIRQLGNELGAERSLYIHVTLLPYIKTAGELKTFSRKFCFAAPNNQFPKRNARKSACSVISNKNASLPRSMSIRFTMSPAAITSRALTNKWCVTSTCRRRNSQTCRAGRTSSIPFVIPKAK
jgi:hypothetical protein